jgi:hypothetical protein
LDISVVSGFMRDPSIAMTVNVSPFRVRRLYGSMCVEYGMKSLNVRALFTNASFMGNTVWVRLKLRVGEYEPLRQNARVLCRPFVSAIKSRYRKARGSRTQIKRAMP